MIPIRDTVESSNYPVMNHLLIAVNVLVYFVQLAQGERLDLFIFIYGLVPARYSDPFLTAHFTTGQQLFSFLSFMFVHGGFWHILLNMWSLYIFGDNVEDHLGPLRYLLFYLLCGLTSGLFHLFFNWHSPLPTVGASGAIAGVMGAYFILHPGARILTLIPIFFIPFFVELPAFIFLGLWFLFQVMSTAVSPAGGGGVAWWAHIGGFVFGIICLKLFDAIPESGMTRFMKRGTVRRKTRHLQAVHTTTGSAADPNLYGKLVVTPTEARTGAHKLMNVPWAFQKRLFRVTVPPGVKDGTLLRLTGMGRAGERGQRGVLLLKVNVKPNA